MKLSTFINTSFWHFYAASQIVKGGVTQRVSIEQKSKPGRGKSSGLRQIHRMMEQRFNEECGYVDLFLATQTPPDLIGLPFKGTIMVNGKEYSITDPTLPTWFITTDKAGNRVPITHFKRGIIHLDEFGKGTPDTKAAAAELFLHGRIGGFQIPDGWIVVASSNFLSDRSGETKILDFVTNRCVQLQIDDDINGVVEYGENHDWLPETLAFAATNSEVVFENAKEDQGQWCTPRSLDKADTLLQAFALVEGKLDLEDRVLQEEIRGTIGDAATSQFYATLRLRAELPPIEEIVADPDKARVPERPDAQMLVVYYLSRQVERDTAAPVIKYIDRLPEDFSITFSQNVMKRDPLFIIVPAFKEWVHKHANLINIVNAMAA